MKSMEDIVTEELPTKEIATLTPRELQTFTYMGVYLTVPTIGRVMSLSHKTIESYQENIKHKLNCWNVHQLRAYAVMYRIFMGLDYESVLDPTAQALARTPE